MNTEKTDQEFAKEELDTRHEVVERINRRDLKPMYDTNHEHIYERDPEDEEAGYYTEMCIVKNCNLGRLISKD